MKTNIFIIFILNFLFPINSFSQLYQDPPYPVELYFENSSYNYECFVNVYPISSTINGSNELNIISLNREEVGYPRVYYNNGVRYGNSEFDIGKKQQMWIPQKTGTTNPGEGFNYDLGNGGSGSHSKGSFGIGIYKVIFKWEINSEWFYDSLIVEQDAGTNYDLYITFVDDISVYGGSEQRPGIIYHFNAFPLSETPFPVEFINNYLKMWDPFKPELNLFKREKVFGNNTFGAPGITNPYNKFPIFCNSDCSENGYPDQNHDSTYESYSREGRINVDLTIMKNITTPTNFPNYPNKSYNLDISAEPDVKLSIGSGANFTMIPYANYSNGNNLIIKTSSSSYNPNAPNQRITTLKLNDASDNSYNTNSILSIKNKCSAVIQSDAKLECGKYSQIFLKNESSYSGDGGKMIWDNNSIVIMKENSLIEVDDGCVLHNKGALFSNLTSANIKINSGGTYIIDDNVTHTISDGGKIELNGGSIQLGTNSKIEFKNGAKLIADGATFAGINGATWQGIETENCGNGFSVKNCTFSNALFPFKIINSVNNANNSLEFIGNTFNSTTGENYCFYINNTNTLRFESNNINIGNTSGVGLKIENDRNESLESASEESAPTYAVLILNNNFNGGNGNLVINCKSSAVIPFQIYDNSFNCNGALNMFAKRISGNIKNNTFYNTSGQSIYLNESSPNIYNNNANSYGNNINSTYSYPFIAPIDNTDDLIWVGGKNHFTSTNNINLVINHGYPTLDLGQNCFTKSGSNYHLYGNIELPAEMNCVYPVRDNIFNGSGMPDYDLTEPNCGNKFSILYDENSADCDVSTDNGIIWNIQDLGNGIYDTIFKSQKTVTTQTTEEDQLYSTATQNLLNKNYLTSINNYKSLITNYPDGKYASQSLGDIYQCYENLDTLRNLTNRSALYGNLKTYLENKIASGLYSDEFIDNAFRIILKCETNISFYTNALEGYEFISLYHPDASMRLYASWDYNEIQSLIGQGGAEKENKLSDKEYLRNRIKYFNEKVNGNPILEQVKSVYRKQKEETSKSETKKIKSESKNDNEIKQRISELKKEDEQITSRVISNIRQSKSLSKTEKLQREEDDLNMILKSIIKTKGNIKEGQNSTLPTKYELSQNYPNPFNPTTKINFALPKQGLVTLKIYDILGREIKTLVNEIKQAGNYTVDFNASEFSSGVYFYRLEAGTFNEIKRMVLLK